MKTKLLRFSFTRRLAILSLTLMAMMGAAQAQDIQKLMSLANQAWEAKEYDKSQAVFQRIVTSYGKRAPLIYGPKFGVIYYRKGLCELKLAGQAKRGRNLDAAATWYEKAVESFKTCHKKYPNGAAGMAQTTNTAHKSSIQRWAESNMGMGEYKKAIDLYKKFLRERETRDKILPTPGGFYINLAICNFLMEEPNIEEGIRNFETAIKNKVKMKTSDSGIVAAFLALSQAVIAKKDEPAMVDFLNKNRADITLAPYQMYEYTPVFMKLAGNALEAEMYIAAFNLYALVPGGEDVAQDIQVRIDQLADRPGIKDGVTIIELERIKNSLNRLREKQSAGVSDDAQALTAMMYLHNQVDNQRGVYGILEQLELYYKKCKKREDNLYNLVRVSSLIGEIFATEKYGTIFLKDFPESSNVEAVRSMMLSSLFFGGEYEKSLEVSEMMLERLTPGSEQHDICLFVLGGSHFYLGHFEKAQPFLDQHAKDYPKSRFLMHTEYFQGSNLTRLQYWEKAADCLDTFLKKYPEATKNIYLPNALYDRANCHFSESEFKPALLLLNRLEDEFPNNVVIDMAFNMKGNIFESTAKFADAEKYYLMAIEIAENRKNTIVAGEALSYIIGMLGVEKRDKKPNPRIKDAVPYYDKFMSEYPNSPFKPQVVVYGLPSMKAVGRLEEGLDNLQATITFLSARENQMYLEECVNAYSKSFLEKKGNTLEMLKELYYNFPGINLADKKTLALLRIALIGAYEDEIKKAVAEKNRSAELRYNSAIKVLFADLKNEFNPKDLTNFVLIRVGDYLREKTSAPKQSLPYYEELLSRKDSFGEFKALLGIADVMGRSASVADNKKALASLTEVIKRAKDDKGTQEKAMFRKVEISAKIKDWKGCEANAREYLEAKHSRKVAMVSYWFALSYDKQGDVNNALANYAMVYARYTGFIQISAPSVQRVMEIMWERDLAVGDTVGDTTLKVGDRQAAYSEIGYRYVASTRRIRETNQEISDEEKSLWDSVAALVKTYEGSGEVKTFEQLKEERLNNRR